MLEHRYLALVAGPFRVALPLLSVREIVDVGGAEGASPEGTEHAISLAGVFQEAPLPWRPALLRLDGPAKDLLISCCRLDGVFDAPTSVPLPPTVAVRWPGLVQGALVKRAEDPALPPHVHLLLDVRVLAGVIEAAQGGA